MLPYHPLNEKECAGSRAAVPGRRRRGRARSGRSTTELPGAADQSRGTDQLGGWGEDEQEGVQQQSPTGVQGKRVHGMGDNSKGWGTSMASFKGVIEVERRGTSDAADPPKKNLVGSSCGSSTPTCPTPTP
eukprot:756963-Hanusia_phi.AAC.7